MPNKDEQENKLNPMDFTPANLGLSTNLEQAQQQTAQAIQEQRQAEDAAAAAGIQEYIDKVEKRHAQEVEGLTEAMKARTDMSPATYTVNTPENSPYTSSVLNGEKEEKYTSERAEDIDTNLKRQNKTFARDNKAWADTEGTTGSKRNEVDENGTYHWKGYQDESGNWVSGISEWAQDNQARISAGIDRYNDTVENRKFNTESKVQAEQQEWANLYYDCGDLVEYQQKIVDDFKAKYDQTYAYASEDEKKALDAQLAAYQNDLEVFKSWKSDSKEMYDKWVGLNEYYDNWDDNKKLDLNDTSLYASSNYMTPDMIRDEIAVYEGIIKDSTEEAGAGRLGAFGVSGGVIQGGILGELTGRADKTRKASDAIAEANKKLYGTDDTPGLYDLLENAENTQKAIQDQNNDIDIFRSKYLFAPEEGWDWTAIEADLIKEKDNAPTLAAQEEASRMLDFVHRRQNEDKQAEYSTKYKVQETFENWDKMSDEEKEAYIHELDSSLNSILYDQEKARTTTSVTRTIKAKEAELAQKRVEYANIDTQFVTNETDPVKVAQAKQAAKATLQTEIKSLQLEIDNLKKSPEVSGNVFQTIASWFRKDEALAKKELSPEEQIEASVLESAKEYANMLSINDTIAKFKKDSPDGYIGELWESQASADVVAAKKDYDEAKKIAEGVRKDIYQTGRLGKDTIADLKKIGLYDEVIAAMGGDSVRVGSKEWHDIVESAWLPDNLPYVMDKQDAYYAAQDRLSYAENQKAFELTQRKDYNSKVQKGQQLYETVVAKANEQINSGDKKGAISTLAAVFGQDEAEAYVNMFKAIGVGTSAVTPRLEGSQPGTVSLLESIFKFNAHDFGAEKGYFTENQFKAFLFRLGDGDLTGAADGALKINSAINKEYKADITSGMSSVAEAGGAALREKGLLGKIGAAGTALTAMGITSASSIASAPFDFVINKQQLDTLGTLYSSERLGLGGYSKSVHQAGLALSNAATDYAKYTDFWYDVGQSTITSLMTIGVGQALSSIGGLSNVAGTGLKFFGDTASEAATTLFTDATFAMSSFNDTLTELIDAGVDKDVAQAAALATGFLEAFFEHYSVENLIHMRTPLSVGQLLKHIPVQALIEASEEGATGLTQRVANQFILGDESDFSRRKNYYMRTYHISEQEASKYATHEALREIGTEIAAGFFSGALSAGAKSVTGIAGMSLKSEQYEEIGKMLGAKNSGGETFGKIMGEYFSSYEFIPKESEQRYSGAEEDLVKDIKFLAEKAANGKASDKELGAMYEFLSSFGHDALADFALANPEYASVDLMSYLAGLQNSMIALYGVDVAHAYLKALDASVKDAEGGGDPAHIVSAFESFMREKGINLDEDKMNQLTGLMMSVLTGSANINETTIRNAFRTGEFSDPNIQMALWLYLQHRVELANNPANAAVIAKKQAEDAVNQQIAALETELDTTTDEADRIVLEQRIEEFKSYLAELSILSADEKLRSIEADLFTAISPLVDLSYNVDTSNVGTVLPNALVTSWDYLNRGNKLNDARRKGITAAMISAAESGRSNSAIVKGLAANRSDNDFVRVNGKDITRKEFVAAAIKGKNAITNEDLPFGSMTEERANNYFDGRIIAYAMAPQSQGEAFTEKFDLLTGQVRDEEAIKRLQERIAQMKKGATNQKQGEKSGYTLPKNAVDKTQGWAQSTEEELEKAIPQLKSEIENLTAQQQRLYTNRTLLAGSADAEVKKANKAAITKVNAELKAKQTQLKNDERDLAVLRARKGRQNEALSSGTSERGGNANVGGTTGTVQSGQVGSAQPANATGSGGVHGANDETVRSGRSGGRGRESVNAAGVEMENGYILFDTQANSNEDDLTSTELALLNRAKELGAERVIFVNAENAYNENGDRIAGVYDTVAKTLVYNVNTDNRHGAHEVDHVFFAVMSPEEKTKFLDGFVNTTFKNRKKLLKQLIAYYKSVNYGLSDDDILEEIFCDIHNDLDRMAQLEGKSLITDEDLQMFKDRTERYIKSSGVEEQIKAKLGTGTEQTTEQKSAPQSQIVGTNNMTVNSEEDFQAVQNALMKLKDKESFFFKYNGQQYVVTVDESKDYGTSYKVAQTVSPSQIFNAKSIGSSDTANGALDIVRNGTTTTESKPAEQTETKAEEKPAKKRSSKKKQEFETEENLRATNSNSEYTRKRKNGKTLVELRKWTDKITNPVTNEGTMSRADFVEKATTGWPELDDIGEPTTMTMAEAQDAFDEWKAAQTPSKKNSILKDYGVDLEETNSAGLDSLIAQITNDYEVAAQQERDAMSGWNARDYADLSPEEYWDAYHEWWEANNIEDIKRRTERLSSDLRRVQAERNWRAIDPASLMQTAKDMFGTTDDFNKAGFILPDGTLLDMSEGHEKRTMFHNDAAQEVLRSLGQPVSNAIDKFVGRGGAIRIDLGSDGIDIPQSGITREQYNTLREFLDQHINTPDYGRNKFYVMTMGLNTQDSGVFNPSNPAQIINGIRQYYNTGEFPQLSSTSAYHYSILNDIKSDTKNYGPGVLFDSSQFTNGEDWVDIANDYVQSMAGKTIVAHDIDTGEDVNLLIANSSQTHRKGNNTGTTRTIGELKINANDKERGVEENKARFLIHLPEVVQVARSNHPFTRPQGPTHGYVDSMGWRYYRVYGMDMDGNIYAAFLNIAQGALGDTLYTITAYPKPIDRNTHVQEGIKNEPLGASDSTMTSEEPTGMATSRDSMFDILSQKFNVVKNIDKKYSILGMTAKGADFGKLSTAVDMELNGSTENEIWKKTGWFRGMDGEWKFEIYDGDFDLNMDLIKRMRRDYAVNKNQTMNVTLGDILKGADILFDNYPQLKSVPVSFARLGEGIEGRVTRDNGALLSHRYLNSVSRSYGARADLLSTIMHETQHLIQGIEKFAGGASETFWENEQDAWRDFAEKEVFNPRSQAELDLEAASRYDPVMFDAVTQLADLRDQARNGDIDTKVYERQLAKVTKRYRPFDVAQILYDYDVIQYLEDNDYTNWLNESPEDLYDNTAGEIEARDVEDRLTMTPRQRRSLRPNTPVESAIFSEIPAAPASRNRYSVLEDRGNVGYNEPNGGIVNDTRRSSEEDTGRTSSLYGDLDTNAEGRGGLGGLSETTGSVRLSNQSIQAIKDSGIVYVEINPTTDNAAFSMRLDEARNADPDHGWAVSPKSVDDIEEYNLRLFMSADGSTGFAIAPDGDIEAVFRNQLTGTRKSTMSSIPLAIANGGTKLDCYGTGLLKFYTQYGFIPVARVEFNPEYANPGWTSGKGYPDVIFMMHNGDSVDEIIKNHGKYHVYTAEEIAALPLYDKEGYMDAYDFRDKELAKLQAESTPQQRKYSVIDERHNEFAPVFYSKMQQTIEDWTGGNGQKLGSKMAAGSVVSWLKGKGVKDEEIKWSGIRQYLEGKKSVTQDELLQVMKENDYKIRTSVRSNREFVSNETGEVFDAENGGFASVWKRIHGLAVSIGVDPSAIRIRTEKDEYDDYSSIEFYYDDPYYGEGILESFNVLSNTNWGEYTLPNGTDYREILFIDPTSNYSNDAMQTHWNRAQGVLAHARIDDMFDQEGNPVLFIEEIQSDWHNAGANLGFNKLSDEELGELENQFNELNDREAQLRRELFSVRSDVTDIRFQLIQEYEPYSEYGDHESFVNYVSGHSDHLLSDDVYFSNLRFTDQRKLEAESRAALEKILTPEAKETIEREYDLRQERNKLVEQLRSIRRKITSAENIPNDAPFAGSADTYHEYVMKHLLRMAAEGDYDKIGWTTAQQQSDRWSDAYAEGYRIEYDQNIPKFMRKYIKQWDGKVGSTVLENGEEVWSVDITPQMRQDVLYKGQPKYSILETAKEVSDTYNLDLSDLDLADILSLSPEELLALERELGIPETSYDTEASEEDFVEEPEEEIEEEEPYIPEERRPSKRVENGERNPTALLKQETLDIWLSGNKGFASPTSKNYAQAYIGWMHPDDFLFLSTGSYESEDIKRAEGYYGDEENISQRAQSGYRADTIYLKLDHETGKLYGHEGRHRMDFLQRLGVENVPVLFFDDSNKYDKEVMHNPTLIGEWNNNRRVTLDTDLIPLNENNRSLIEDEFVNREGEDASKPTVRFSLLSDPDDTYDAFGDPIKLDNPILAGLTTSDLSDRLYYSSDGNTGYYKTPDGQLVVLDNIGPDSPEAQYIRYLEAMNNANDTNTTATKPYIIPPRSRYEDNGYSLGEQNAGLRRGTEEVPEAVQEGTLRRRGSSPELYGQSRPQSQEEESVRRYSILVGTNEKSNRGDTTFPIVNDQGETITTADIYPLESFERHLLTAVRDDRLTDMEDVINEWFDRGGRIGDDSWTVLTDEIKENQNYTDDEKKALYAAIEKARKAYGDLAKGRDDKKPNVILPKKADNGDGTTRNIRKNIQTTAANVDNELLTESLMFKAMNDEMMGYTPQSNPETVQKARDMIKNQFNGSFDAAYSHFRALKESGKLPSAVDIALGEILIKEFGDGDKHPDSMNKAINVAADLAILGTDLGQAIQALRIIKKATPQGQLYYLDGVVKRLNATYAQRIKDGKMTPVEIKEALAAKLLSASTRQELNDAIEAIKEDLASQIPVTLWDQWNAWRYLAMLGNPRTHIRNIFGNAFFMPIVFVKDMALRRLQNENSISNRLLSAAMGGEIIGDEFRTMVSGADLSGWLFKNNSNPYVKFARDDYQLMKDIVKGKKSGSKYSDANDIISRRKVFEKGPIKSRFLQKYNDFNSEWLEREDTGFQEKYYVRYLAEYLQAQGITEDQLTGDSMFSTTPEGRKILNKARQYATLQAQRDTYHEMNQFAMELNRMKGKGGWRYVLGEGLVPFTGTPANLLKLAAVQYSPYGLMRSIVDLKKAIREGNKDTASILDNLASGLTGTGLILLGAALAAGGLGFKLRGAGPDDDKEAEFEEMQGHQSWSIETDKWSYTIDWMAPLCMPLFVGATMYELFNREIDLSKPGAFSTLLFGIANPMLSMSMLDGIENTLSSLKYGGKNAMATLAASMLTSYFAQGMPTIAGQLARSLDDRRRATYIDPNSKWPGEIQRFWQSSIQNKIPDLGKLFGKDWVPFSEDDKTEYVDMWGRNQMTGDSLLSRMAQNFLSPGYFRWINETAVDDELARLYEAIGGTEGKGALPTSVGKEISKQNQGKDDNGEPIVIDGKKLTAEEYVTRQKVKGQTAYAILSDMFNDELYKNATDNEKLKMIDEAYKFAESLADQAVIPERNMAASWMDTAKRFGVSDYILIKQDYDNNKSNDKVYDWILSTPDLTTDQMAILFADKFSVPDYIDSEATGYRYKMLNADEEPLTALNETILQQRLPELFSDQRFIDSGPDEQAIRLKEFISDIRDETLQNYSNMLSTTSREYTLGKASRLTNDQKFEVMLDAKNGDHREQANWIADSFKADKVIDNPDHMGYEFELDEAEIGEHGWMYDRVHELYADAYEKLWTDNKKFKDAVARNDKQEMAAIAHDTWNAVVQQAETEYGHMLNQNGTGKEKFKEKPTGYSSMDAYKIAREKYGDDYKAIGRYIAQTVDNHTTIEDPEKPGYFIVLNSAEQAQGKKDRTEMFAELFATEAQKDYFKMATDEEKEAYIKGFIHAVDVEYQKQYAEKIKKAGYDTELTKKLNTNDTSAKEFLAHMEKNSYSKEETIDLMMARYKVDHDLQDVNYNPAGRVLQMNAARKYYEDNYEAVKSGAMTWEDYRKNASTAANKAASGAFGVKSVGKIPAPEYNIPGINPSFPSDTGSVTVPNPSKTSSGYVIPPAPSATQVDKSVDPITGKTDPITAAVNETIRQEYRRRGWEAPKQGEVYDFIPYETRTKYEKYGPVLKEFGVQPYDFLPSNIEGQVYSVSGLLDWAEKNNVSIDQFREELIYEMNGGSPAVVGEPIYEDDPAYAINELYLAWQADNDGYESFEDYLNAPHHQQWMQDIAQDQTNQAGYNWSPLLGSSKRNYSSTGQKAIRRGSGLNPSNNIWRKIMR